MINRVKSSITNLKDGIASVVSQAKTSQPTVSSPLFQSASSANLDMFDIRCIYKSKPDGRVITSPDIRFFTRHYRSGKADEPSVEQIVIVQHGEYSPDTVHIIEYHSIHSRTKFRYQV